MESILSVLRTLATPSIHGFFRDAPLESISTLVDAWSGFHQAIFEFAGVCSIFTYSFTIRRFVSRLFCIFPLHPFQCRDLVLLHGGFPGCIAGRFAPGKGFVFVVVSPPKRRQLVWIHSIFQVVHFHPSVSFRALFLPSFGFVAAPYRVKVGHHVAHGTVRTAWQARLDRAQIGAQSSHGFVEGSCVFRAPRTAQLRLHRGFRAWRQGAMRVGRHTWPVSNGACGLEIGRTTRHTCLVGFSHARGGRANGQGSAWRSLDATMPPRRCRHAGDARGGAMDPASQGFPRTHHAQGIRPVHPSPPRTRRRSLQRLQERRQRLRHRHVEMNSISPSKDTTWWSHGTHEGQADPRPCKQAQRASPKAEW
eukprot:scaffold1215_cov363-Pavlova_lutheri.AAC.2